MYKRQLFGSNLIHLFVESVYILLPAIVKEALAEVEGKVLAVVASHAYLCLLYTSLLIMNGWVDDVKQWGKHGDEESLIGYQ